MFKKFILLSSFSLLFTSCVSMAPKLQIDTKNTIPDTFKEYEKLSNEERNISLTDYLIDEQLKQVVNLALENSKDIKIAILNIESSKALYKIENSNYYPKIDANSSLTRKDENSQISNSYKANLSASFELDLFGKIKSLNDSAKNSFLATKYALNSTKLSLISQTINSYLSLASNIEYINLTKELINNLNEVYELTQNRYKIGASSKDEVLSSKALLIEAKNTLIEYENQMQIDINSLEPLLGTKLPNELLPTEFKKDESYIKLLKANLHSNILLKRPDIKELEYKLRAKNANIGVARAAFFPSISLTATTGFASSTLNNLFSSQNSFWQFSPSITLPIFSAGENMANLEYTKIEQQIALKEYEKGIQTAFKEVNDALIVRKNISTRLQNQIDITNNLKEAYNISFNSYKIGANSYLNMLVTQKTYINSQKDLISMYLEELENRSQLYKVLGGSIE